MPTLPSELLHLFLGPGAEAMIRVHTLVLGTVLLETVVLGRLVNLVGLIAAVATLVTLRAGGLGLVPGLLVAGLVLAAEAVVGLNALVGLTVLGQSVVLSGLVRVRHGELYELKKSVMNLYSVFDML